VSEPQPLKGGDSGSLLKEALKYEGQPIVAIQFQPADQPLTDTELRNALPIHSGSIFHERDLRQAIQNLFATGRFSDLAVDASASGNGIALRFITQRAYFVGRVLVTGVRQPPTGGQLYSATKLRLGAPYRDSDKTQAIELISSLLRKNGFYRAGVTAQVQYEPQTETANINFVASTGRRARFEEPVITGDPLLSTQHIVRATHWKRLYGLLGWQQVTGARVEQGLNNIRRYYDKHNLLESTVTLDRLSYREDANTVEPSIAIEAGPRIVVRVDGANIDRGSLSQLVPVYEERSLDPDLLAEGQRDIQRYLQSQGYFGAEVADAVLRNGEAGEQIVTYHVDRGRRHKFVHLSISGVHYFSQDTIRERLYVETASFPRFPYGRFSPGYLQQDVQSIRNLYVANGFRDVKVTYRIADRYHGVEGHLAAAISVVEGPQWFVSHVALDGVDESDLAELDAQLASAPGQPFSEESVASDRDAILNYYYGRGYTEATFEYFVDPAGEPQRVMLRYVVHRGPRKFVRAVLVSGLETTRKSVVDKLISLGPGDPLSLTAQTDSQRRLYNLGIFARVNTAVQNPNGDEEQKYVLYDLNEARPYSLNIGVGAQIARFGGGATSLDNPGGAPGFAPRVSVTLSRINFMGRAQTVSLQTAASTIEQRAALTYFIPEFVSNPKLNLTTTALVDNSNYIRTYTSFRREASVQLGQRVSRAFSVRYGFVFRNVLVSNVKIEPELIPLLSQPETVGLAEISLIRDTRDDPTDAHSGTYTALNAAYAAGFLGSQTQFFRGLSTNSSYYRIRRDLIFARNTQFGVISRTGGMPEIPLAERLYAGGPDSIRAFPIFQAGPRDLETGFPLGGNALLVNSFELRFPIYGDNLSAVLFQDAGNVYATLGDVSFRFRQQNLQDFDYMVQDAGIGIRYRTPIGPIRLDVSFSPDAPRFFGLKGTYQDLINGTAVSTVQKINAFQFQFSLGQAF